MYIANLDEVKRSTGPQGKTVAWLLAAENGTPNFEMRYFEVPKGLGGNEESHPFEHEVFVLKGEGVIKSGDTEQTIKPGDAILILPDEPHQFFNFKEEPLGFICVIPNGCEEQVKPWKILSEMPKTI
jgi:quercetin dioxygenase-like cupin family protein